MQVNFEVKIPWSVTEQGFQTKLSGTLMMIEATTSLPFRDLLRSETLQINVDCNYPMKWNAYQVKNLFRRTSTIFPLLSVVNTYLSTDQRKKNYWCFFILKIFYSVFLFVSNFTFLSTFSYSNTLQLQSHSYTFIKPPGTQF